MAEGAKGQANLPQLEIQGNYRGVTAQGIGKVYYSNIAHRQLVVSDIAQSDFKRTRV